MADYGSPTPDFRMPVPPFNEGEGDCHDPVFELVDYPSPDRVFHTGETLSATVRYEAANCTELRATFGVRHVAGSPRFEFYCNQNGTVPDHCMHGFDGNIFSEDVVLAGPTGTVTITAQPGEFPPESLESHPDLDGAQLCSVVLSVNDGIEGGSASYQQLDVGCPEGHYPPYD